MKALTLCALMLASPASAATLNTDQCEAMGELAGLIMRNRQEGTPLATMLEGTEGVTFIRRLVLIAYSVEQFDTVGARNDAAEYFQTTVELECYSVGDVN